MNNSINHLPLELAKSRLYLELFVYPGSANYYWSDDYSAEYYIAVAKAGFISVTEEFKGKELLIPEIQHNYALLDFKDLHISRKVQKLLKNKNLQLKVSEDLEPAFYGINALHKNSWLSRKYLNTLKATKGVDSNFKALSFYIEENGVIVAGELGYIIGKTYTSLSGFCLREKHYNNYGTAQLVLLAKYLEQNNFAFWNLGHPHMSYKKALGAKVYTRAEFLRRWREKI